MTLGFQAGLELESWLSSLGHGVSGLDFQAWEMELDNWFWGMELESCFSCLNIGALMLGFHM